MKNKILSEAERLYQKGFGVLWLRPKSKQPIDAGWTKGDRKEWDALKKQYREGLNVGTRLGSASKINGAGFLAVIDVDVKSKNPAHQREVVNELHKLFPKINGNSPRVLSGRGNGSQHIYVLTPEPVRPKKLAASSKLTKVKMPGVAPSARDKKMLSSEDIAEGFRVRNAWEISLMGEGQQVVLPPSVHPDTGKEYSWGVAVDDAEFPVLESAPEFEKPELEFKDFSDFESEVDVATLPLDDETKQKLLTGEGVEDRSTEAFLVCIDLIRAGLSDEKILNVLTDTGNFLGAVGYEHAKTTDRARAAKWVQKYCLAKAKKEAGFDEFRIPVVDAPEVSDVALQVKELGADAADRDWTEGLARGPSGKIKPTLKNVTDILWNGVSQNIFKRDLFSTRDYYAVDTPWGRHAGDEIEDDDAVRVKLWLETEWKVEADKTVIFDAFSVLALRNSFHPVRDYVRGLEWDGVHRIDTWMRDYMNAKGPEPYLSEVSRKILCAMVARVFEPGIKFDYMPILEGTQGIGKSTAAKILAGENWFCDNLPDLRHPDARLNLKGNWIVEMGELSHIRASEIENVKAYISSQFDQVRPPYGRKAVTLKRQCVFMGTTNDSSYLKDRTGNRRFWPVEVGQVDFAGLRAVRDQLFAEAMVTWEFGEQLWLSSEAEEQARDVQSDKMGEDIGGIMHDKFLEYYRERKSKENGLHFDRGFSIDELFGDFGPFAGSKMDRASVMQAAYILKSQGFKKCKIHGLSKWKKK